MLGVLSPPRLLIRRAQLYFKKHYAVFLGFILWEAIYGLSLPYLDDLLGPVARFLGVLGVLGLALFGGWRSVLLGYPLFLIYHLLLHRLYDLTWMQGAFGPILGAAFCFLMGIAADSFRRARVSEQQLQNSLEALAYALDQQTRFLATAAHEIRTPLNSIKGHAQLLMHNGGLTGYTAEGVNHIERASRHLESLVTNILDLTRAETDSLVLNERPESLHDLLAQIIKMHEADAKNRGLHMDLQIQQSVPEILILDPMRLSQVLSNLLGNAIKYTTAGYVRLSVDLIRKDSETRIASVRFEVQDSGPGILESEQAKIFDPFFRIESPKHSGEGSMGLGLSIAAQICKRMGSQITLQSRPGEGSTFSFPLELRIPEARTLSRADSSIKRAQSVKTIWIADDNRANILVLEQMLDSLDYQYRSFNDGSALLSAIQEEEASGPDAFILDAHMTLLGGMETAIALGRHDSPVSQIPTILLTADSTTTLAQETGEKDLFAAVVFKPMDLHQLSQILASTLEEESTVGLTQRQPSGPAIP